VISSVLLNFNKTIFSVGNFQLKFKIMNFWTPDKLALHWSRFYLFWAVDDEVTARIERALVELSQIAVVEVVQQTVARLEHDRNLADGHLLVKDGLFARFRAVLDDLFGDVYAQRRCVGQISEARLVRRELFVPGVILLPVCWLRQVHLLEFQVVARLERFIVKIKCLNNLSSLKLN